MNPITKMLVEKRRFVPTSGYNVVGVDQSAAPGDSALYLIEHTSTREAAEAVVKRAPVGGDRRYVYAAAGVK